MRVDEDPAADAVRLIGEYLLLRRLIKPKNRKTDRWRVYSNINGVDLGLIAWMPSWRCYSFDPAAGTTFEHKCLMAISIHLDTLTRRHRNSRKVEKTVENLRRNNNL